MLRSPSRVRRRPSCPLRSIFAPLPSTAFVTTSMPSQVCPVCIPAPQALSDSSLRPDLEDAARLDSIKGRGWEERLAEMRRLVAPNSRITSRFAVRLEEAGPIPLDFQELESAPSACPRPGCSGKECSGEDAHITRAKDAVAHFTNGANSHLAKSTSESARFFRSQLAH